MQLCSGAATDDHRLHSGPFAEIFDRSFLLLTLPSSRALQKLHFVSTAVAIFSCLHQCGVALLCPASAICRSPASALHVSTSDI